MAFRCVAPAAPLWLMHLQGINTNTKRVFQLPEREQQTHFVRSAQLNHGDQW